jgi:hypothetical protein
VIPYIQEAEIGLRFKASQGKKLVRPSKANKPGMVVHAYNLSYEGDICRRNTVEGWLRQKSARLSKK